MLEGLDPVRSSVQQMTVFSQCQEAPKICSWHDLLSSFISAVILKLYIKQLHIFNLGIYCRNCYSDCGANSRILVSSLCSSQKKREKSSPKKHFTLIKTWNNSGHNSEHPKSCSSSYWFHKSQHTGCTDSLDCFVSGPLYILSSGVVHLLNVLLTWGGSKSRWH